MEYMYNFQILNFYNYRKMLNEVFENEFLISVRLAYDMRRYIKSQECITFKFFVFFFNY